MSLTTFISKRIHGAAILGCVAALTGASQAEAGTVGLGTAGNYNVYVSGNMNQSGGDVATSVAVGGNATMTSFGIYGEGITPSTGSSLVVGGNLNYSNGTISGGNTQVGGNVTASGASVAGTLYYGGTNGATNGTYSPEYAANGGISSSFFSGANATLASTSSTLASQLMTGTLSGTSALVLTGTTSGTEYFNLTAAQLAGASSLTIDAATGATVVVNVAGTSDSFSGSMSINGTGADKVLFNFNTATSLSLLNTSFDASILAPLAAFTGTNGNADGNTMVASISAPNYSFEYHDTALFDGTLNVAAVPEPPTIVLTGLGAIGAIFLVIKNRKTKPLVLSGS